MMTIKISTLKELEEAWPILRKLEPDTTSYGRIKNSLPRFIYIHVNLYVRGHAWTHSTHSNYYNYPLVDISALYNLEETNPELFL